MGNQISSSHLEVVLKNWGGHRRAGCGGLSSNTNSGSRSLPSSLAQPLCLVASIHLTLADSVSPHPTLSLAKRGEGAFLFSSSINGDVVQPFATTSEGARETFFFTSPMNGAVCNFLPHPWMGRGSNRVTLPLLAVSVTPMFITQPPAAVLVPKSCRMPFRQSLVSVHSNFQKA